MSSWNLKYIICYNNGLLDAFWWDKSFHKIPFYENHTLQNFRLIHPCVIHQETGKKITGFRIGYATKSSPDRPNFNWMDAKLASLYWKIFLNRSERMTDTVFGSENVSCPLSLNRKMFRTLTKKIQTISNSLHLELNISYSELFHVFHILQPVKC